LKFVATLRNGYDVRVVWHRLGDDPPTLAHRADSPFRRTPMRRFTLPRILTALTPMAAVLASAPATMANPIPLTAVDTAYTQDFNGLANSGTPSTTSPVPTGWLFLETGSNANATYSAGTGSSTTGDTFSFGAASATDRAFGGLASNNLQSIIGAPFLNDTATTIHSVTISFYAEMWRRGQTGTAPDRMEFRYRENGSGLAIDGDPWSEITTPLNATTPRFPTTGTTFDGNDAQNRALVTHTITGLDLAPGETFWVRWNDVNVSGNDDGLAIDDFSIVPNAAHAPATEILKEISVVGGGLATTGAMVEVALYIENLSNSIDIQNLLVTDVVPGSLTFVPEGFELDLNATVTALTPDNDGDAGTVTGANVVVAIPSLPAGQAALVTYRARLGTINANGTIAVPTTFGFATNVADVPRAYTGHRSVSLPVVATGLVQVDIFFDTNNNGTRDEGEEGLEGWDVLMSEGEAQTTGPTGSITSGRLLPGNIDILIDAPTAQGTWNYNEFASTTVTANQTAVVLVPVTCSCNDNNVCTQTDRCDKGSCFFENPVACADDGNPCTDSACDPTEGCRTTFNTNTCDDTNLTTRGDRCDGAGTCVGTPYVCQPGPCQVSSTHNGQGCDVVLEAAGTECSDGNNTTRNDACSNEGSCVGEPYSCPPSDSPCVRVIQDGVGCGFEPINPGGECNDGNTATRNDVCDDNGACAGQPYECPASTSPCITNVPNGVDCTATPTNLGGQCNDNSDATGNDVCLANGTCAGTPIVCDPSTNPCMANVPNGTTCVMRPTNLGGQCSDNNTTTRNDACNSNGQCAGETYECPASTNPCITNVPNGVDCTATPTNLGDQCNDNSDATGNDVCLASGTCAGTPIVCDPSTNPCMANVPNGTTCVMRPTNLGGSCTDNSTTTRNDTCNSNGQCVGEAYECPASTNPCIANIPNGVDCTATPTNLGGQCNDNSDATGNDICQANGTCAGTPIVCDPSTNPCMANVPNGTTCVMRPTNLGGSCTDNSTSTRNDTCNSNGQCVGETYECPASPDPCIANVPNGIDCTATPTNLGGTCNDNSDATANDVCTANGTCAGAPIVCTPSTDPCQANVPNGEGCVLRPTNLGGTCNDNSTTTRNDVCNSNGQCAGEAYECPASTNPCLTNVPNGVDCTATPINVGGVCDDGAAGTKDDVCTNEGTCAGTAYTCETGPCIESATPNGTDCDVVFKAEATPCDDAQTGTRNDACNASGACIGESYTCEPSQCEATSVPNGTDCDVTFKGDDVGCDDGNSCTSNDLCNGVGRCTGTPVECGDGEVCGTTGACAATHCEACGDDGTCGSESACLEVGPDNSRCLLACTTDEDCADGQVCREHATGGLRCFDTEGPCVAPSEPNPDVDPVEPTPDQDPEPVEPNPEAVAEGETITSGGGGCTQGAPTASALWLLALMGVVVGWRRRARN
jgi:hypothetical protein